MAATLLAIGMLAMSWLQAASLRHDKMSQFRGTAIQLATGLADRMRANVGVADHYGRLVAYAPDTPSTIATDCGQIACTADQLATYDLATYRNITRTVLPGGDLQVTFPAAGQAIIWLLWLDPEAPDSDDASASLARRCPPGIGTPVPAPQCLPVRVLL